MTEVATVLPGAGANGVGLLSKERTYARPGFNRWLVPPAALAIHLSIGMAYGFSVFWLPLSRAVGITSPVACPADMTFLASVFATGCDWKISTLGWMYHAVLRLPRRVGGDLGRLARARRSAQGRGGRRAMLVRRARVLRPRRLPAPDLDAVAGLRRSSAASGSGSATSRRSRR